jgi:hypothetical protein
MCHAFFRFPQLSFMLTVPYRPYGARFPRGEGWRYEGNVPSQTFGHRHYFYAAALPYFYAPHHHFSFLISNF